MTKQVLKFDIKVIARAKHRGVLMGLDGTMIVKVTEPAEDGRANLAVVELLAKHFRVSRSAVRILHGVRAHRKSVEVTR